VGLVTEPRRRLARYITVGPLNARGERRKESGVATRSGHWWPSAGILVRADAMSGEIDAPDVELKPSTLPTTVTRDQLSTDRELVAAAARQPGGVQVVDEQGRRRFTIWIPMEPIDCGCDDDPLE
jgi:hypothetical protein